MTLDTDFCRINSYSCETFVDLFWREFSTDVWYSAAWKTQQQRASKESAILQEKLNTLQEKASKDVAISAKEASDKLFMVFNFS